MGVNPGSRKKRSGMARRATLKEVAAEVGVSLATVSNAYNRPDQLSGELRERVFEAAKRLGYTGPDAMGRSLRKRRAGAIGVLYTDRLSYAFTDPAAAMFLEGLSSAAEEAGYGMLLLPRGPVDSRDMEAVIGAVVDGFVTYCAADDDPLLEIVLRRGSPVVFVDHSPGSEEYSVGIDDEGGARAAAEHLASLGHRRFGVVSFHFDAKVRDGFAPEERQAEITNIDTRSRFDGYRDVLEATGGEWSDVPVYECGENTPEKGKAAAEALLAKEPRPTAIFALSDQLAFGVMEAAKGLGLSVPEDLSVVGFDDVPEAASSEPPLTTVYQPHVEKGMRAGRKLVALLGGEDPGERETLPTKLVVRGSTANPKP
jgi:DNA-binding LacI/PurR family transcriptional regulator